MLTFYSVSALVNCLASLIFGIFVLLAKRRNPIGYIFAIYAFSTSIWSLSYFFWQTSTSDADAYFWLRCVVAFAIYIAAFYLHFTLTFLGKLIQREFLIKVSYAIFSIFFLINLFTDWMVVGIKYRFEFKWGEPGIAFTIWLLLWILCAGYATYLLYKTMRNSKGVIRAQSQYIFWGFVISFVGGSTNYLLWYDIMVRPYGNIVVPAFVLMTAYAIIKHRFLDIRFVAARSITYTFLIGFLGLLYVALGLVASIFFLEGSVDYRALVIYAGITLFIANTFQPLKEIITQYTDRVFFKSTYTPAELLYELGQTLTATVAFEEVLKNIYELLSKNLHLKGVTFAVKIKDGTDFSKILSVDGEYAVYSYGMQGIDPQTSSRLVSQFEQKIHTLVLEDLRYEQTGSDNVDWIVDWMTKKEIAVALPLQIKNEVIGMILLGEKLSGDTYSTQDIDILETFALQAAIGIENTLLFMHSRDFNLRLKTEVDEATSELTQKNRNLEILRKMDSIIMTTLDPKEISQKIVDTIAWELGYDGAIISIVDYKRSMIVPTAVSKTPLIEKSLKLVPRPISDYCTPLSASKSLAVQSLMLKSKIVTTSLADAFEPVLPRLVSEGIQKIVGMKGVVVYPIMSKDQPLGVLTLATHKLPHDMTAAEHNLLDAFMDEVAIALENAYLYEEARNVNTMLYKTNKDLVGLDKMKDEFVSIASHELRTPMTAINGYVWMLLQGKGGPLSEKQSYYLERVSQSTQRLINLVNDMLSVSRIESGRIQITASDFDIVESIKSVHEELQIKADEKKIVFSYTAKSPVMKVKADPDKVREVITNLLGNAMKFTDKGSIITRIDEKDGQIYVSVTDTGRGVSEEDMPKLFKKFGRLDNTFSTVAATSGTGLGLYICKTYIESMGGRFEVQSELGKGSTFAFYLPKSS